MLVCDEVAVVVVGDKVVVIVEVWVVEHTRLLPGQHGATSSIELSLIILESLEIPQLLLQLQTPNVGTLSTIPVTNGIGSLSPHLPTHNERSTSNVVCVVVVVAEDV